jgi:general secretion pathway protein H
VRKNGFTLLEVLIVLTLVTVILSLTSVYFAGYLPAVKLAATGRELSALIRHARTLAREHGTPQRIMINLDDRTYGMENKVTREIPAHVLVTILDPVSGEIRQGIYSLVFHPGGSIEGGSVILSRGKKNVRIDLDPVTGAVIIKNSS